MFKIKEALKRRDNNKHRPISILVVMVIIILMISTAIRSISLYNRYKILCPDGNIESNIIDNLITDNNDELFNMIIHDAYDIAIKEDKISTDRLESDLLEKHSKKQLEDVLNSKKFDNEIYDTIDNANNNYFKSSNSENINFLIIGTEDKILYAEATAYHDKFKHLSGTESDITWDVFYSTLNNPTVTKEVFDTLKNSSKTNHTTIMRIDGKYNDDKLYDIDDILKIYKKEGINGIKGFGFVTLSTITEDGDILGHRDSVFMRKNNNCKKLYVYHYMDIREYVLDNLDKMMEQNIMNDEYINILDNEVINDFLFSLATILFNIISIIGLMFVYKSLEESEE